MKITKTLGMLTVFLLFFFNRSCAQSQVNLVGYIYESNNRGYLNNVEVTVQIQGEEAIYRAVTNQQGKFEVRLPITDQPFQVKAEKTAFQAATTQVSTKGKRPDEGVFTKLEMTRQPGYMLELAVMEFVPPSDTVSVSYGVEDVKIEIYDNTLQKELHSEVNNGKHLFKYYLEQGTEYIFLLRKEGYYARRMRANINVNGCILCMEGFGTVEPSITENLTRENTMGMLRGSVTMRPMILNETMELENIYYDFGKSTLRPEAYEQLNELVKILYDNPQIVVELSSHTDSRGNNQDNLLLSQRRAEAVVSYIKERVTLQPGQLTAKGYGETRPVNSCVDGVTCEEFMHQQNRRTELTVIDILAEDPAQVRSLSSMMQERNFDRILAANSTAYTTGSGKPTERYHQSTPSKPEGLALDYSGYKIQVLTEPGPLQTSHFLFYELEGVTLDIVEGQHYAFMVGNYKELSQAQKALVEYQRQYPEAKIVRYENGNRMAL